MALRDARAELKDLFVQREELERRIARTRQSVIALGRLCPESTYRENMKHNLIESERVTGLTNAVRLTVMAATVPIKSDHVRKELEAVGFDTGTSPNVHRSIHTILGRLCESGEIIEVGQRIKSGREKGLVSRTAFWYGQWSIPKGWSRFPDKRLQKHWAKIASRAKAEKAEGAEEQET